jgi:hypothetical protein
MATEYIDDNLELDNQVDLVEEFGAEEDSEVSSIFDELDHLDFEALGINPNEPTEAKPGSERKVLTLAARYAAGLPLWDQKDRYDHAPGQTNLSGLKFDA